MPYSSISASTSKLSSYMFLVRENSDKSTICVAQPVLSVWNRRVDVKLIQRHRSYQIWSFRFSTHCQFKSLAEFIFWGNRSPVNPTGVPTEHRLDRTRNRLPIGIPAGDEEYRVLHLHSKLITSPCVSLNALKADVKWRQCTPALVNATIGSCRRSQDV